MIESRSVDNYFAKIHVLLVTCLGRKGDYIEWKEGILVLFVLNYITTGISSILLLVYSLKERFFSLFPKFLRYGWYLDKKIFFILQYLHNDCGALQEESLMQDEEMTVTLEDLSLLYVLTLIHPQLPVYIR